MYIKSSQIHAHIQQTPVPHFPKKKKLQKDRFCIKSLPTFVYIFINFLSISYEHQSSFHSIFVKLIFMCRHCCHVKTRAHGKLFQFNKMRARAKCFEQKIRSRHLGVQWRRVIHLFKSGFCALGIYQTKFGNTTYMQCILISLHSHLKSKALYFWLINIC